MVSTTDLESPETTGAVRAVAAALTASDFDGAYKIAEGAIARGAAHPAFFGARAVWQERQGRDEDALADFERASSLAPKNVAILNAIGLCLTRLRRLDEAVAAFDEAIAQDPAYSPSYHRKGIALGMAGDAQAAQKAHEQAVRLNPRDTEALANLASIAARKGRPKAALDYAERALALDPRQPTAIAAKALLANSEARYVDAERLCRPLLDRGDLAGHARAVVLGLLADALDGQNRVPDAFEAYAAANEMLRRLHAPRFAHLRSVTDFTRDLVERFQLEPRELWQAPVDDAASPPHVFLLGFYRSGTTLLGQILGAHPDIVTLEEQDFLLGPAANYLGDAAGLARLATLSDEEMAEEREAYWKRIADSGVSVDGRMLVDKQPLNAIKLPLIAKLFPNAKIILAVRDPRDVVLSCFRRQFDINAAMYDLLTLEGTAAFYDIVMQFVETMERTLDLPFLTFRYEDMVEDFDTRVAQLCAFIGVAFDPAMRQYHASESAREVSSPSGMQVTRELYSEGVDQWRPYREQLAPALPVLAPWIAKFGYSPE